MDTQSFRFGDLEIRLLFALEEAEAGIVSSGEIAGLLRISRGRANKLAWQLARKNRLFRVKKGVYLFAPMKAGGSGRWSEDALAVVSQLMGEQPYYVGYWAALSHYGLSEQIPVSTQVIVAKRMKSFEAVGSRFEFIRVRRLGQWRQEKIAGKVVKIATVEQLIIDCLTHPEHCGGMREATKAVWASRKTIDWKEIRRLTLLSNDAVCRRLGFVLETLGLPAMKLRGKPVGWRWLDPSASKQAKEKSAKWGLIINVTKKELTDWMET